MIPLDVIFHRKDDPNPVWPDEVAEVLDSSIKLAVLEGGMESGAPSVAIRIEDGKRVLVVQTTAKLFVTAAKMIEAKYPELLK